MKGSLEIDSKSSQYSDSFILSDDSTNFCFNLSDKIIELVFPVDIFKNFICHKIWINFHKNA